ncbi:zinc finger BED domain-containing protein RICESLEEPER 2-like protein [Tanacetum coccineum]
MATQSRSTTTSVGSSSSPTILQIVPTTRNPQIWKDFHLCKMSDNTNKAQCIHCFHFFSIHSNSTLKNHISHPHCEPLKTVPEPRQSSMSRDGSAFVYNLDAVCEQFAGLVIQEGLPFNHFDKTRMTRVFQNHLQPKYTNVSRTTLKRDAMKLWIAAKQLIKDGFLNLNYSVNITMDVWTAPHSLPDSYLCVTTHLIEPLTWQMMKRVIAFKDFPVPYRGPALFNLLSKVFAKFHLKEKVLSITLDNASNNTRAIGRLKLKYSPLMDANESTFPVISQMARDILSVQATSVASESAFSTSDRVLSIRRTRLTPTSLEMCMCLKDHMDAAERVQHTSNLENSLDFEAEILEEEVQEHEAITLSDEELAMDEAASKARSIGGEEIYDMTLSESD